MYNYWLYDDNYEIRDWVVALEKHWIKKYWEEEFCSVMSENTPSVYLSNKWRKFKDEELESFIAYYYKQNAEELFENFKKLRKKNNMDEDSKEKENKSKDSEETVDETRAEKDSDKVEFSKIVEAILLREKK